MFTDDYAIARASFSSAGSIFVPKYERQDKKATMDAKNEKKAQKPKSKSEPGHPVIPTLSRVPYHS